MKSDGLHIQIGPHQGSYPAWWSTLHLEIHRLTPTQGTTFSAGQHLPSTVVSNAVLVDLKDDGKGQTIVVQ